MFFICLFALVRGLRTAGCGVSIQVMSSIAQLAYGGHNNGECFVQVQRHAPI